MRESGKEKRNFLQHVLRRLPPREDHVLRARRLHEREA